MEGKCEGQKIKPTLFASSGISEKEMRVTGYIS